MALRIEAVPCLRDNYAYLIFDPEKPEEGAWVVDPGEAAPVDAALAERGLSLTGILLTHHHPDHVGGNAALVASHGPLEVLGFADDAHRLPEITHRLPASRGRFEASGQTICGLPLETMHIPGHTTGAIALKLGDEVFTGDTLFAAGCGRLFEGTPAMMHASLQSLCALPEDTRLWFGHEYTAANLRFASSVEPDNDAMQARAADLPACTTPSTVALERATNPFVRAADAEELGARRKAKDEFRG